MSKPFLTLVCFCFKPICEFCFKQKNNLCLEKCFKQSIGNRFKQICKRTLSIETKQNKTISMGFSITKTKTHTTVSLPNKQVFLSCFFFLVDNFLQTKRGVLSCIS